MSRIYTNFRLPDINNPSFQSQFYPQLIKILNDIAKQLNQLSEGGITAVTNATTAAPTAGTYQQGDKVMNTNPTEAGGVGSKYIIIGWICVSAGTPGTWREMRVLTGN